MRRPSKYHLPMKVLVVLLLLAMTGCSGDEPAQILTRWTYTAERPLSAAARGPERRIIVAEQENPAKLVTFDETLGAQIDGPFDVFPSLHAPVVVGNEIYLVTSIGRIQHTNLGAAALPEPGLALGLTAPAVAAPDGSIRVAATTGRLVSVTGDTVHFDVTYAGAADTPPAVAEDGTTYVATDTGDLLGFDNTGGPVFNETLPPPASGPSVRGGIVAVGHANGVTVFDAAGSERFMHPRAARVTGTRILENGNILAWGEDGAVELLDASGSLLMSYSAGPPIYTEVIELEDAFAVIDSDGVAHLVGADGALRATLPLGGTPQKQIVSGAEIPFVFVTIGKELIAVDFSSRAGG